MIQNKTALQTLIQDTPLAKAPVAAIDIPDASDKIFLIGIPHAHPLQSWSVMRALVPATGRWPLLVTLWDGSTAWPDKVRYMQEDLANRFAFTQERMRRERLSDSPADIVAASADVDVDEQLREFELFRNDPYLDLEEDLAGAIEATRARCGIAPEISQPVDFLLAEQIYSRAALERWLFAWEYRNSPAAREIASGDLDHLQWFEPHSESLALMLLPSERHWEAPAYLHWFGAESLSSHFAVALLREWHLRYGTELVGHHGTMLELTTRRLPASPEEAFYLAWQQETVAPSTTLPAGVSLRDHARALMHTQSWFLHSRP